MKKVNLQELAKRYLCFNNRLTMKQLALLLLLVMALSSCQTTPDEPQGYSLKDIKVDGDRLTPELLWSFGRIGDMDVSPDGEWVVYTLSYPNIKENKSYSDVYLVSTTSGAVKQITDTKSNEFGVAWRPDGKKIAYMSAKSGDVQLWEMDADGSNRKQVTFVVGGITGFRYSPDMSKLLYTADVKLDSTVNDVYPDLPLANARIETDLMYRHWDHWHNYTYSHPFVIGYNNGVVSGEAKDIMAGEHFASPLMPHGGIEHIVWSPDGKNVVYTSKKLRGKAAAFSTNSDLYLYDIEAGTTENITQGMMGYDQNPVFSPSGRYLAWESMARDGYEADKINLKVRDMQSSTVTTVTENFDQNVANLQWEGDSVVWFISNHHACDDIYKVNVASSTITKVTKGEHDYVSIIKTAKGLVAKKMSISQPVDIYSVDEKTGSDVNLSNANQALLAQLKMGKVEGRWIPTTDGQQMLTWVIYPPDFDPSKKYPAILYCQGGPQSTVSQFWSYRWNFQLMAANGYVVVAPNRRGLPGFGQAWNEQISGDYGGQNMKDYLSAIDALAKEPYVDADRLGAVGASYGGFSVYWLAGNHQKRFKAFIAHCGIFNFEQMYLTTEEMFFVNWDLKGAYWEKENLAAQKSYGFSPHHFVRNWDTPILVVHGEQDFRIPYTQGMAAFNGAVMNNVPARYLHFPDENHWVLSPQNGILWQREFFSWLDRWLKE
jgi:dipeptidyl aminopeptidase/acylaminoacyl peptidase